MIDGFWISTFVMIAMTLGVIYFRYSSRTHESNWPLVYYGFVVLHLQLYPEALNPTLVYAAVVCGLLLRFEFMSGGFLKAIQILEYIGLLLLAYRFFDILFV